MPSRADIQAEARSWVGTPFRHQGRHKGRGVDCAGVLIGTAQALGYPSTDWRGYARQPDGHTLERLLDAHLDRGGREPGPGDVILMRFDALPQHVAIATELQGRLYMVHAYSGVGRCVEHRIDETWQGRIVRTYQWRDIDE